MKKQDRVYDAAAWNANMEIPTPRIVDSTQSRGKGSKDSDIDRFLSSYEEILQETIHDGHMPEGLTAHYSFESCIRKDPEGKKEIYLLRRRRDGAKALLRITKDYPEEDALEEAKLLKTLHHPGIPKVHASFEHDGKTYIIREYIEGRSLYEVVKSGGRLRAEDIFSVMLKLTDILRYLHAQSPPVDDDLNYFESQGSILSCLACGGYFVRHSSRQLYCSSWDCQAERNRRNRRASYARKKATEAENKA